MSETFTDLVAAQLAAGPGRPLVTFYDDRSGERVELSVLTYANWVAKTAGLLQDELGLERGSVVLVDLPTHWLGPVWLGAAWSLGLAVTDDPDADVDLVVCGPDTVDVRAEMAGVDVVALSLQPLATRFADPLPAGVLDFGVAVWGQPDSFAAYDPARPDDLAWSDHDGGLTQRHLLDQAHRDAGPGGSYAAGARLLTDLNPASRSGLGAFLGPLVAGGGTVWVASPDPSRWAHRAETERTTAALSVAGSASDEPAQPA